MINRAALLLRYKEPAVRWINAADPSPSDHAVTLAEVNEERTVYLIEDIAGEDPEIWDDWLQGNYENLFENELDGWYTDPALWPQNRSLALFLEWFEPERHTVVIDMCADELFDDGT